MCVCVRARARACVYRGEAWAVRVSAKGEGAQVWALKARKTIAHGVPLQVELERSLAHQPAQIEPAEGVVLH